MLKTIAEAIIHLLTLLLQIFVHQLERQEVITETEIETDPQIHGQLQEMMNRINMQKTALENLKDEIMVQKKPAERKIRGPTMGASSGASAGSTTMLMSLPQTAVTQRRGKAPSVISHAATWEEIEEIEEVMIQQNVQMTPVTEPTNRGAPPVPTMPLPGNLTLEEWGSNLISFGRKHKGKSFEAEMRQDPGYFHWNLARYSSLMPEQQDFVRFGQLWMSKGDL
jgi:hypothetical protein